MFFFFPILHTGRVKSCIYHLKMGPNIYAVKVSVLLCNNSSMTESRIMIIYRRPGVNCVVCELRFFYELAISTQVWLIRSTRKSQSLNSQSTLKSQKCNCFTTQLKPGLR